MATQLYWLPAAEGGTSLSALTEAMRADPWPAGVAHANTQLDFLATNRLDEVLRRAIGDKVPQGLAAPPVRLAILSSCTTAQLHPAIRIAGLRRNIHICIYEVSYGQYWQELTDPTSGLHAFRPTMVLFALDAHHLANGVTASMSDAVCDTMFAELQDRLRECWRLVAQTLACPVLHQVPLPVHPKLMGSSEHRLHGSKAAFIDRLNQSLPAMADAAAIDLLGINGPASQQGLAIWHDETLWHRAKQEVSPTAAPLYGDMVGRVIAAKLGRSFKCLVLDLDNTLWGGVIGDDGLDGIVLGQGSSLGEAFVSFQEYVRELSRRGVILAVCSKNDMANAVEPFDSHPEMILKRSDIGCFVANWSDKAANIRMIAAELNIGLDSIVFVDDNPFERTLVRQELPSVAVPELNDDPATYARTIADAGYFEATTITQEDRERSGQYQENRKREALRTSVTDLDSYLRGLEMQLVWRRFDEVGLSRITQLINKTNQFNLTTRRYSEDDVRAIMLDDRQFGLQLRLLDRFGDNGMISVIIAKYDGADEVEIDTWLMSCRVLGRQVERATLSLVVSEAMALGAKRLVGEYCATKKNGMVRDHYARLGFDAVEELPTGTRSVLDISSSLPNDTCIKIVEG